MKTGKNLRMQKFLYPYSSRGLIVPIDHGLTLGPLSGIQSVQEIRKWIGHEAITGIIAHKGMAERLADAGLLDGKALMVHLNGMSTLASKPDFKRMLTSVETAKLLGADAVSLQVNFDGTNDAENLEMLGRTVDEASREAMPVLAMVYDKVVSDETTEAARLSHLIRIAMELGCEAVKIGPPKQLEKVLKSASSDIRIFIAGGSVTDKTSLLSLCEKVLAAGGSGLCVGRNVFQRENVGEILDLLQESLGKGMGGNPRRVAELAVSRGAYGIH